LARERPSTASVRRLQSALGLRFRHPELLQQALRHRSFLNEQGGEASDSYERLEFLGDAVLGMVTAAELYRRYPQQPEGELTKSRSALVCQETLARVARRLELGDFLLLGKGEEANDGRRRDSILAAAFEAVVAAVYLDRDYATARRFLLRVLAEELDGFLQQGPPPENPKSRLQEQVQGLGHPAPRYRVVSTEGPDHSPLFTVEVLLEDQVAGVGQGRKKVDAERAAAQEALEGLVGGLDISG
jgi:ribonuclease-3